MSNRSPAASENFNVVSTSFAEKASNFREKLDVTAVVTGNANRAHVLLDRSADDVAHRAMISEINDLDPVPDKFEIDCVDRAVVPVTNRDGSQNSNRSSHLIKGLTGFYRFP